MGKEIKLKKGRVGKEIMLVATLNTPGCKKSTSMLLPSNASSRCLKWKHYKIIIDKSTDFYIGLNLPLHTILTTKIL